MFHRQGLTNNMGDKNSNQELTIKLNSPATEYITQRSCYHRMHSKVLHTKNKKVLKLSFPDSQGTASLGLDGNLPGYFHLTGAESSSFRTNFFLRASEIKEAESSSLRDVQPLLYLQRRHPSKTETTLCYQFILDHIWNES